MNAPPFHDIAIDARDLLCPLPVLKARKRLGAMAPGQVLRLLATDPAAAVDVPHFCAQSGHGLLGVWPLEGAAAYFIRRGPDASRPETDSADGEG